MFWKHVLRCWCHSWLFAYYFDWVFECRFQSLIFTIAKSKFAFSAALQLLWTTAEGAPRTYCVDDRVQIGKSVLVASRLSVIHLIDFLNVKGIVYEHSHDLAAVIMACKMMKAVEWSVVLPFSRAQWSTYDFVRGDVSLFPTAGNSCLTVHGAQYCVALPVVTAIPWRRTPPFWKKARVQGIFFFERYFFRIPSPSSDETIKSVIDFIIPLRFRRQLSCSHLLQTRGLRPRSSIRPSPDFCQLLHRLL